MNYNYKRKNDSNMMAMKFPNEITLLDTTELWYSGTQQPFYVLNSLSVGIRKVFEVKKEKKFLFHHKNLILIINQNDLKLRYL